jgi:hypothetical protein
MKVGKWVSEQMNERMMSEWMSEWMNETVSEDSKAPSLCLIIAHIHWRWADKSWWLLNYHDYEISSFLPGQQFMLFRVLHVLALILITVLWWWESLQESWDDSQANCSRTSTIKNPVLLIPPQASTTEAAGLRWQHQSYHPVSLPMWKGTCLHSKDSQVHRCYMEELPSWSRQLSTLHCALQFAQNFQTHL